MHTTYIVMFWRQISNFKKFILPNNVIVKENIFLQIMYENK